MENQSKNKLIIVIMGILIILLVVLCILFATGTITLKSNNSSEIEQIKENNNTQKNNNYENETNEIKKLDESEQKKLFESVITNQIVFIDDMIIYKDFSKKDFLDKEIIYLLIDSSESNIFTNDGDNIPYKRALITDVETSAKKLFGKKIDINALQDNNDIKILDNYISLVGRTGVGIISAELISIDTTNNNEYIITFKYSNNEVYKLTIEYDNENIVYKSFEK